MDFTMKSICRYLLPASSLYLLAAVVLALIGKGPTFGLFVILAFSSLATWWRGKPVEIEQED
jgi:hypothetical protein